MGTVSRLPAAARRKVPRKRLTGAQLAKQGIKRILPTIDDVDPRRSFTADMIIAEAILAQLSPEQKRGAQNAAHHFFHEFGTDHARAASAFMASIR